MSVEVDRDQVLAYRVAAQELVVGAGPRREPAVLDLGVQDTPYGSARLALAAREAEPPGDETLTLVWSIRGAPHLHRPADLPALTTALWPLSDADATARIKSTQIKEGARLGLAAFTATAEALRAVVTAPMNKGDVSTGVSARVPKALTYWCQSCQAQHISGELFQQAGLAGGVRVEPRGRGTTLAPIAPRPALPAASAGIETLVETYLRLLGPAGPAEVADFLGTTPAVVRQVWPDGLAEVRVGGRRRWLPADQMKTLRTVPPADVVRLLPPSDPYLQARDRDLLVPDRARRAAVWRVLGKPGALLVDGEIAGVWRARKSGRAKLEITITAFDAVPARVRTAAETEARRVAAARDATDVTVTYDDA